MYLTITAIITALQQRTGTTIFHKILSEKVLLIEERILQAPLPIDQRTMVLNQIQSQIQATAYVMFFITIIGYYMSLGSKDKTITNTFGIAAAFAFSYIFCTYAQSLTNETLNNYPPPDPYLITFTLQFLMSFILTMLFAAASLVTWTYNKENPNVDIEDE